ncbi:hypothetical protein DBT_0149 [Dissulfuribacter thermophilus]|uniref:Uncharacterized protein n=1 Tax=Dissulfuribacter thermophilus TaxID=1156395 RepID=A0A1B9F8U0_9BACT|nr:hypothetical protein DBT_0149 [Dissulfuribacter thermophilus]
MTMVRPIYLYQRLPNKIEPSPAVKALLKQKLGVDKIPLDGHVNGFAVQFSYAFNERFSFVAVKDGYADINADGGVLDWEDHSGWLDLAAGFQYSFLYDPENDFIVSGRLVAELPTGSDDVFQGNGDGNIAPSVLFLKGIGNLQINGVLGFVISMDNDDENTLFYDSWHISYAVTNWFRPLVELNHFHVLSAGDRDLKDALGQSTVDALPELDGSTIASALHDTSNTNKWDELVAGATSFNGCDIINLGGTANDENRDLVTLAIGARFRVTDWLDFGAVYEFPLTDEEESLMEDRFLLDAMITLRF